MRDEQQQAPRRRDPASLASSDPGRSLGDVPALERVSSSLPLSVVRPSVRAGPEPMMHHRHAGREPYRSRQASLGGRGPRKEPPGAMAGPAAKASQVAQAGCEISARRRRSPPPRAAPARRSRNTSSRPRPAIAASARAPARRPRRWRESRCARRGRPAPRPRWRRSGRWGRRRPRRRPHRPACYLPRRARPPRRPLAPEQAAERLRVGLREGELPANRSRAGTMGSGARSGLAQRVADRAPACRARRDAPARRRRRSAPASARSTADERSRGRAS